MSFGGIFGGSGKHISLVICLSAGNRQTLEIIPVFMSLAGASCNINVRFLDATSSGRCNTPVLIKSKITEIDFYFRLRIMNQDMSRTYSRMVNR